MEGLLLEERLDRLVADANACQRGDEPRQCSQRPYIRGESFSARKFAETETLRFEPLPCWTHLTPEQYRAKIADLIAEIEAEAAAQREQAGCQPLGVKAILRQKPTDQPVKTKISPAPLFHAFSRKVRKELYEAYGWFVAAFREAADKLKAGDRNARFPVGSFPPHLAVRQRSATPRSHSRARVSRAGRHQPSKRPSAYACLVGQSCAHNTSSPLQILTSRGKIRVRSSFGVSREDCPSASEG